jgi:hypothetical protein
MSKPTTVAAPAVGVSRPVSMRIVVVFPEPFAPRRPKTSPRAIVRSSPATATKSPKVFRS